MPSVFERGDWGVSPGDAARVFATAIGRIGILIGYDAEFPLIARAMAEAGAEILLVPSSTDSPAGHARVRLGAHGAGAREPVHRRPGGDDRRGRLARRRARKSAGVAAIFGPADAGFPEDGVIAAGKAGNAGWVTGEASLDAVWRVREEGSVRTFADWPDQARALAAPVETVPLGPPAAAPDADPAP